ncbi:limb region 1 homolog-like protein isoform 2-T2 [Salvelinus alpinus]
MEVDDVSVREQLFHNKVRETFICVLLFTCLYILSYLILTHFKKNADYITTDDIEDATVNKIALWLCTFPLQAVAVYIPPPGCGCVHSPSRLWLCTFTLQAVAVYIHPPGCGCVHSPSRLWLCTFTLSVAVYIPPPGCGCVHSPFLWLCTFPLQAVAVYIHPLCGCVHSPSRLWLCTFTLSVAVYIPPPGCGCVHSPSLLWLCTFPLQAVAVYIHPLCGCVHSPSRLWLCTFTLSVAVCAVLLLPISILSNEVLLTFPHSYYMQWLNGSLIHGLWNLVFLFSNLSLVFLMPFAYFFTESEGFVGCKKGVMARVYETAVVLLLLTLLVLGMVWVGVALLNNTARESLYDVWECYLPYLYSAISLFGVLLLLLCTPYGLSRMFSVTGSLLVKPGLLENVEVEMNCAVFEEASLSRKLNSGSTSCRISVNVEPLRMQFLSVQAKRIALQMRRRASPWQRNLFYPLAMLLLLALTVVCVLMVCFHVLELLFDETAMPRGMGDPRLGTTSFSMFGSLGAAVQVVLIMYLMVSSVVGFYSSPLFTFLLPHTQDTNLTQIIGNCVSLLVLSSALPVFSRTLGITRFDLLGDFGRYNWLGNFHIVFLYNVLFAGLTSACLINTLTWTVQRELIRAFGLHKLPLTVSRTTIPLKLLLANGLSKIQ